MQEEIQKSFFDNFKGNLRISIPVDLMKDIDLSPTDKMLYILIDFHSYMKSYCWISNEKLAEELNTSARTVQRSLENLEKKCYIKRENKKNQRLIYTINKVIEAKVVKEKEQIIKENCSNEILDYNWYE